MKTTCPESLRYACAELARDLQRNKLDVVTAPAPSPAHPGHKIRVAQAESPEWYQQLCKRHQSAAATKRGRRWYTKISRYDVLGCLRVLSTRGWSISKYAPELVAEARQFASLELMDAENCG